MTEVRNTLVETVRRLLDDVRTGHLQVSHKDYAEAVVDILLMPATCALLDIAEDLNETDEWKRLEGAGIDRALNKLLPA